MCIVKLRMYCECGHLHGLIFVLVKFGLNPLTLWDGIFLLFFYLCIRSILVHFFLASWTEIFGLIMEISDVMSSLFPYKYLGLPKISRYLEYLGLWKDESGLDNFGVFFGCFFFIVKHNISQEKVK